MTKTKKEQKQGKH